MHLNDIMIDNLQKELVQLMTTLHLYMNTDYRAAYNHCFIH